MELLPFLPDLCLLGLAIAILALEIGGEEWRKAFHLAWMGLAVIIILPFVLPGVAATASFGSYRSSQGTLLWKQFFTLAALASVLLSRPYFQPGGSFRGILAKPGAFYGLLVLCAQGMFAIVSARDLLTFFLGLELATLPLYALAAFQPRDGQSVEAASKYVLMGGFSSALSLFGISFLYGFSGGLGFDALGAAVQADAGQPLLWGGIVFLMGGLGFKLSMAPLHMWAPDVYQGSPTPVMAFLSVGSKAAAVAALTVLFLGPLNAVRPGLAGFIAWAAVLSMVVGNLGAMRQSNLRRFVAYSSVAQVGYMLVALLGDSDAARVSLQYNLAAYGATSFALYFIVGIIGRDRPEILSSLRGLSRQSPGLAALLVLCMFSLAGIPPLAGFLGKFMLFSAAAAQGHYILIGIAIANAVVSFYYYMLVVKEAYIAEPETSGLPIVLAPLQKASALVLAILLLVLGLCPVFGQWLAARSGL